MGADKTSSNFEVTMLENSVILLEGEDYKTRYEGFNPNDPESYIIFSLLQNAHLEQSLTLASLIQQQLGNGPIRINRGIKQAPLVVLWRTSMPSVLVELGFISNSNDLRVMADKKNQDKFARLLFTAFVEYKKKYDKNYNNNFNKPSINEKPNIDTSNSSKTTLLINSNSIHYRVQILSVTKPISNRSRELKGYKDVDYIKQGNTYKYTIGKYHSLQQAREAQSKIRKSFPQAFIIKVENNRIIQL
jgi:N-acetylmuramoyl-L-alanine amidase